MAATPALRALLGGALILLYALAMHYTLAVRPNPDWAAGLVIAPFFGAGVVAAWHAAQRVPLLLACAAGAALLAFCWPVLTSHVGWLYYVQHAGIYALLGLMFGRTLSQGKTPLCTQLGAFVHDEMTPRVVRYTRQVTVAWTLFFAGTVATSTLLFFFGDFEAWSFFANVLGMPLTGAMFVIEFAVRHIVLPPGERGSLANTWRAWRKFNDAKAPAKAENPPLS